jgi:hypothetical protein
MNDFSDTDIISAQEAADKINWHTDCWAGNCYAVACEFVEKGLVQGATEYGLYSGPVNPGGRFEPNQPIQRHGWIRQDSGNIIDPTRWVFEVVDAYIAVIPIGDERQDEYDMGGVRFRRQVCGDSPPPEYTGEGRTFTARDWNLTHLNDLDDSEVCLRLGPPPWDIRQMCWLGNRSPAELGNGARVIYEGLIRTGCSAMIPIDFRISVFGTDHDLIVQKLAPKK